MIAIEFPENTVIIEENKKSDEIDLDNYELSIIQKDYNGKLEVMYKANNRHVLKASQYVGYVILPKHIIKIQPKIAGLIS